MEAKTMEVSRRRRGRYRSFGGLIAGYAEKGIMLPRSRETLIAPNRYVRRRRSGRAASSGAVRLCRLGEDLVEIRSARHLGGL